MKSLHLPPRLALAASFVRPGVRLADIGTDHALLPVWLLSKGLIRSAIAADVVTSPLQRAVQTVEQFGFVAQTDCRLSDGFSAIAADEYDDAVICGMGGLTIVGILEAAHPFRADQRLILQPMTDIDLVRRWLLEHGYSLLAERAVHEDTHVYSVILAAFTGNLVVDEKLIYTGLLQPSQYSDDRLFLQKQFKMWGKHLGGAKATGNAAEAAQIEKILGWLVSS